MTLSKGLEAITRFFVGDAALRDTLQQVTEVARQAVPGADLAGITMLVDGRPQTAVFTDALAPEVDQVQYDTGKGPCMDAFRLQQVFRIDSTDMDRRWRPFSEAARARGIRSVISLPLVARRQGIGALNFYSRTAKAFSDEDLDTGMHFANQAAIVLAHLASTDQASELADAIDGVIARLIRRSSCLLPDDLPPAVAEECARAGLLDATIFLTDLEQRVLTPLGPLERLGPQDIDSTIAGRCFQLERPLVVAVPDTGEFAIWIALVDGADRLGVLYARSPASSDHLVQRLEDLAGLVAGLLLSKMKYGDGLHLARRTQPMTLAAELRWAMLPPLTFTSDNLGIACELEPAYEVAGDAFDYAVNDGVLHLAVMDAMGHGLEACRMANLATAGYRTARRRGLDLPATYRLMDHALRDQFDDEHFVTAQLATLDIATGRLRWVNAGHPPPMLLRNRRVASELRCEPALPLGMGGSDPEVAELSLEPTDALLFFTDGIVEAGSPGGERFGQNRLLDLTRRALADEQTLAETVRRLVRAVRAHREGPLADDATILFVAWQPQR
jgi:GAF domain-containing protein